MPTGYTAKICEGDQTFKEFALTCARAFGACFHQRDEGLDQPPKLQEPDDYYMEELDKAIKELERFKNLSNEELSVMASDKFNEEVRQIKQDISNKKEAKDRIKKMLTEAKEYNTPTTDHDEFKKFMIDQLEQTLKWEGDLSYYENSLKRFKLLSGEEYRNSVIEGLQNHVEYCKKFYAKEINRVDEHNKWLKELINSLNEK